MTKVSERLDTVKRIASELESRYSSDEIVDFLTAFKLHSPWEEYETNYEYARRGVQKASSSVLSEIIEDLGIAAPAAFSTNRQMPGIWEGTEQLRVFISHLSSEKAKATRLRDVMRERGMAAFVAHEDIEPRWNGKSK